MLCQLQENRKRERLAKMATVLTSIVILLGLSSLASFGAPQEAAKVSRLNLGFDKSTPGNQAYIPIILSLADGVEIGKIITEISFPTERLSFEEARRGASADSVDAQLQSAVKMDDENPDNSILEMTITSEANKAIPSGIVVHLIFQIADLAPAGEMIPLRANKAEALTTGDSPQPVDLAVGNGEIETLDIPVMFACFFYMH